MSNPRGGRLIAACALALLACLIWAVPASAHGALIGSNPKDGAVLPTAPTSIELDFAGDIGEISPAIVLRDDRDEVIEQVQPQLDGRTMSGVLPTALPQGSYSVAWRIVSADGHPLQGVVRFAVGQPSAPLAAVGQDPDSSGAVSIPGWVFAVAVAVPVVPLLVVAVLLVRRRRSAPTSS